MEIKEFKEFCENRHDWLTKYYQQDNPDDLTFPMTLKIMEELGELSEAILAYRGLQRGNKLKNFNQEHLQDEFADVLITLGILAHNLGIDLEESLQNKIKKIKQRDQ